MGTRLSAAVLNGGFGFWNRKRPRQIAFSSVGNLAGLIHRGVSDADQFGIADGNAQGTVLEQVEILRRHRRHEHPQRLGKNDPGKYGRLLQAERPGSLELANPGVQRFLGKTGDLGEKLGIRLGL